MKEILIDTPLVSDEDFFVRNRKKKIIIALCSIFGFLVIGSLVGVTLFYHFNKGFVVDTDPKPENVKPVSEVLPLEKTNDLDNKVVTPSVGDTQTDNKNEVESKVDKESKVDESVDNNVDTDPKPENVKPVSEVLPLEKTNDLDNKVVTPSVGDTQTDNKNEVESKVDKESKVDESVDNNVDTDPKPENVKPVSEVLPLEKTNDLDNKVVTPSVGDTQTDNKNEVESKVDKESKVDESVDNNVDTDPKPENVKPVSEVLPLEKTNDLDNKVVTPSVGDTQTDNKNEVESKVDKESKVDESVDNNVDTDPKTENVKPDVPVLPSEKPNDSEVRSENKEQTDSEDSSTKKVLTKEEILKCLKDYASKNNIYISTDGSRECKLEGCKSFTGGFVNEWKLRMLADMFNGKSFDPEYEIQTLKMLDDSNNENGIGFYGKTFYKQNFIAFRKNRILVETHNSNPNRSYNMALNSFATFSDDDIDLTNINLEDPPKLSSEVLRKLSTEVSRMGNPNDQEIHVDWRDKGVITEVIHQGNCGSCWAIASVDLFTAFYRIKHKKNDVKFSIQQVLDCTHNDHDCTGGVTYNALEYIKNHNMCTSNEYKYLFEKKKCHDKKCKIESQISGIKSLKSGDHLEFLKNNGPFLSGFRFGMKQKLYDSGIYNEECVSGIFHSVLVVGHGYDKVLKKNYWIVKNSWGKAWGEDGYIRILDDYKKESKSKFGTCDITVRTHGFL